MTRREGERRKTTAMAAKFVISKDLSAVPAPRWTRQRALGVLGGVILGAALTGCQMSLPSVPNPFSDSTPASVSAKDPGARPQDAASQNGETETPRFTQFTDIPIPANAKVDLDNLLVLGSEDGWIGRLALDTGYEMTEMYAFYEREMPRFGWDQITIIRSAISTMTYSRGGRIATITLLPRATGGSNVDFTVAPGSSGRAAGVPGLTSPTPRREPVKPRAQVGSSG